MLNLVVVKGSKVDDASKIFNSEAYNVVKEYNYVDEFFEDILEKSGEFLSIDVALVLQFGLKSENDYLQQIISLQEAFLLKKLNMKLYFILKDLETYNKCEENLETSIIYDKTVILYMQSIKAKSIIETIEGKKDNLGLRFHKKPEENYNEELEIKDKPLEKKLFDEQSIPDASSQSEQIEDKPKTIEEIRKSKKAGKTILSGKLPLGNLLNKDGQKEQVEIKNIEGTPSFKGILGVYGDRNSGVSNIAANLAKIFAYDRKVLLLDMDLDRRFQSVIFKDFEAIGKDIRNSQIGLYTVLNNPYMLEEVMIVVEDNLALISMSRNREYYLNKFAEKNIGDLLTSKRMVDLLGVAKSLFDVVIIDFPNLGRFLDSSVMVDRFILCTENTLYNIDNLFDINFREFYNINDTITASILNKSELVLNKFNNKHKVGKYLIDREIVNQIMEDKGLGVIKAIGEIQYSDDFYKQYLVNKRVVDINKEIKNEFIEIALNIGK